jgi:integrase
MSSIRRKPSGRFEARYRDPSGRQRARTFDTKRDARQFLDRAGTEMVTGTWRDPALGRVCFEEYATWWLEHRPDLRPRTKELYEGLLRRYLIPGLGSCRFERLNTAVVRVWHTELLGRGHPGPVTVAKAYRLLRTILNDAIDDGLLLRNPCTIRAAGVERSPERPVATVGEVYALAEAIEDRYRMFVLLGTFCGLRMGELLALRRDRIDLGLRTVHVLEQRQELKNGTRIFGPPKSDAGRRSVAIPPHLLPEIEEHLDRWTIPGSESFVFSGPFSESLRRATFNSAWDRARKAVGLEHLHFHDLRHTGNTLAAATGASTKELMARMGHASPRAALIYQHATADRDIAIAEGLSALVAQSIVDSVEKGRRRSQEG